MNGKKFILRYIAKLLFNDEGKIVRIEEMSYPIGGGESDNSISHRTR